MSAALLLATAAAASPASDELASIVDPIIQREMAETGMPGAAFVFVEDGRIAFQRGYGVPDIRSGARVDPARTVWPIASVTKVITAMAVLQLVDEDRIALDADVNDYLERIQVPAAGYAPLTLRHLLSHTGGLDELPGRQYDGVDPPSLATFLRDRLVRFRAPGEQTAYSTYGILLAALVLEDVGGEPYADAVRRRVFEPLGMTSARVMAKRGDEHGVATPYRLDDGRAEPQPFEWYVSTPASSVAATVEDMGRLLLAQLASDTPALRSMHRQQATVHPAVPGWSLGMQMDDANGRVIAEHGGDIGGFSSLFVVLPDENAGFFIVNHGEGSNLRFEVKEALLDRLYPPKRPPVVPAARAEDVAKLREYAGPYRSSFACHSCPAGDDPPFLVEVTPDGALSLWGQAWIPLEKDVFIRDDGKRKLAFARGADGRITAVSAGSWRVAERLQR
jgi:CubicO group peptidase (beta-lactamase class C family)